ncbi:hypothetical protein ACF0H5_000861 [Mactra antiquata]
MRYCAKSCFISSFCESLRLKEKPMGLRTPTVESAILKQTIRSEPKSTTISVEEVSFIDDGVVHDEDDPSYLPSFWEMSMNVFNKIQAYYVLPSVDKLWNTVKGSAQEQLRASNVVVAVNDNNDAEYEVNENNDAEYKVNENNDAEYEVNENNDAEYEVNENNDAGYKVNENNDAEYKVNENNDDEYKVNENNIRLLLVLMIINIKIMIIIKKLLLVLMVVMMNINIMILINLCCWCK